MKRNSKSFYYIWNLIIAVSATFLAIFLPAGLIFNFSSDSITIFVDWLIALIFIFDIVVQISDYRYNYNEMLSDEAGIKIYLKSWFIVDLIAAIPFELLFPGSVIQLLLMVKLSKVGLFMFRLRRREIQFASFFTLFFFVYWISVTAHWISLGWLSLRGINPALDYTTNYIHSLYWCTTTLTTVGYGDITPDTNSQIIYTMFVQLMGVGFYGYLIGNIASILTKKNPAKAKYLSNLEKLSALVQLRKIPYDLQERVRDYYTYMWRQKLGYDESSFLKGLPDSLQTEISIYLKQEVIESIELFKGASPEFIREVAMHLQPVVLVPGDFVFHYGEQGEEMYFVVKGELQVLDKTGKKVLSTLKDGDFFGEIALFMNKPRTASIKAITYCDLYYLEKKTFDYVVEKYKDIARKIEIKAFTRDLETGHKESE